MAFIELLAPAGDLARAKVALDFGADAVYIGGKRFSLRYRASNFEVSDIAEAVEYAHARGKRIFVTVNMIPPRGSSWFERISVGTTEYWCGCGDCGISRHCFTC